MKDWRENYLNRFYRRKPGWKHYHDEWLELLSAHVPNGTDVLEVGAGPENDTSRVLARHAGSLTGLDVDPDIEANIHLDDAQIYEGGEFPFPAGSFDVVVAHWVNEHLEDPVDHFREISRVLRPGGRYIFRTPNLWHYKSIAARLVPNCFHTALVRLTRNRSSDSHDPYPTFYRANTGSAIQAAAQGADLKTETILYSESYPAYGMFSRLAFLIMMAYERMVNYFDCMAGLRHTIDGVLVKEEREETSEQPVSDGARGMTAGLKG